MFRNTLRNLHRHKVRLKYRNIEIYDELRFLLHHLLTFELGKQNWNVGPVKGSSDFPNPKTSTSHNRNSNVKTPEIVVLQCSVIIQNP